MRGYELKKNTLDWNTFYRQRIDSEKEITEIFLAVTFVFYYAGESDKAWETPFKCAIVNHRR